MKTNMPCFNLLSLCPKSILLCLLCDHRGRLCKYFSFTDGMILSLAIWRGKGGQQRRKGLVFFSFMVPVFLPGQLPPAFNSTRCFPPAECSFSGASLLQGVVCSDMQSTVSSMLTFADCGLSRSLSLQHGMTSRTQCPAALTTTFSSVFMMECCW